MPEFAWEAVTDAGTRRTGRQRAATEAALTRELATRGLHLLDVRAADRPATRAGGRRRRDVLEVTRALASLLAAGLPLARALTVARDVTDGPVAGVLDDVRTAVERGETLAAALAPFPSYFPPVYTGLVHAGERSGDLAGAFQRLTTQLERDEALRGRLTAALLYPLLLAIAGAVAVAILLLVVLPRFATLLAETGAALPASTRVLLALSGILGRAWPLLLVIAIATPAAVAALRTRPDGRRALARVLLATPGVGALRRQLLGARFARLLAALLGGGAPLYAALADVHATLDDPIARDAIADARERVRTGASLTAALRADPLFPATLVQLVSVGEASADLDGFLRKAADLLDDRAGRTAQRLATLAEPTLIVVLGAVVAAIAFALLQAIYGVNAGAFAP